MVKLIETGLRGFLVLAFLTGTVVAAQNSARAEPRRFFSGTVVGVSKHEIRVVRTIPGREPRQRVFVVAPDTKVEGRLEANSRVTVRYVPAEESDVAVHIIVRERKAGNRR